MRLVLPGGAAALVCAVVLAACSDQPSAPGTSATFAEGMRMRIHGSATLTTFETGAARSRALPDWSASGSVRSGFARDETATSPLGMIGAASAARGVVGPRGGSHIASFTDDAGKRHTVIWIFLADGGPVHTVGHYVDGRLETATEYGWKRANGGFALASVRRSAFRDGKILFQVTGAADGAPDVASADRTSRALERLGLAALRTLAPGDAQAQILSGPCRKEWLDYIAATAALAAAQIAITAQPGNAALYFLWLAAAAKATNAEMALWMCEMRVTPVQPIEGPTGGIGGGSGAGALSFGDPYICQFIPTMPGCREDPMNTQ